MHASPAPIVGIGLVLALSMALTLSVTTPAVGQHRTPVDPCLRGERLLDLDPDFCRRVGGQPLPRGTVLIEGVPPGYACHREGQELNLTEADCLRVGGSIGLRRGKLYDAPAPRASQVDGVEAVPLE